MIKNSSHMVLRKHLYSQAENVQQVAVQVCTGNRRETLINSITWSHHSTQLL